MFSHIRIVPKTTYTSATGATASTDVVLAKLVNSAAFVSAVLIVRVHVLATASGFNVVAQNASFSEEEPNTSFFTTSGQTSIAIPTSGTNLVIVSGLATPISDYLRVILQTPVNATSQTCTISVDLVGRDA